MVALPGGQFLGVRAPIKMAARYFMPPNMTPNASSDTVATTAARYYVVPFFLERPTTFAGAWCYNGGAGDNGDKVKIAAYNESSAGGPGTLAKSFGEVTLTGAAAVRTFASSWSASPGWYYLEIVTDNSVTMYVMSVTGNNTAAGIWTPPAAGNLIGMSTPNMGATVQSNVHGGGEYVAGTYSNFPEATSLTPTNTLFGNGQIPYFGLYT